MGKNKGLKTFAGITLGLIGGFFAANMAAIAASAHSSAALTAVASAVPA